MRETVRIAATGRGITYLPEVVAREFDFFDAEGLQVEAFVPPAWEEVLTAVASGDADLALGGVWVPAMYHGRARDLVVTAQLCNRAAFTLVGREEVDQSEPWWQHLHRKSVFCPGRGGASLGMLFQMFLTERGADVSTLRVIHDLDGAMAQELFEAGAADFLMTGMAGARDMSARGYVETCQFLEDGGEVPWSVYYTTRPTLSAKQEVFERFNRAMDKAMSWMNATAPSEYLPRVLAHYPGQELAGARSLVEAMQRQHMWVSTRLNLPALARWQAGICDAALIAAPLQPRELASDLAL
jgi:NitT/TauT family transport system substrate-binding protein